MLILGIETSCDETAAALVKDGVEIVSNVVASSQELHVKTGGIIPEQAAREQIKCILPVIEEATKRYKPEEIDAIAVTYGPGLIGSLLVGLETAKTLAYVWKKPIVPVNHLVAHIYANFIVRESPKEVRVNRELIDKNFSLRSKNKIEFPAMVLIVSGGHTELVLMKGHGDFHYIGGTRDDAAGEAFDKIARILGLGYPGGPAIQQAAETYQDKIKDQISKIKDQTKDQKFKLPRPMMNSGDFDFSFSGLKTHVLNLMKNINIDSGSRQERAGSAGMTREKIISTIAYEVQEAITDVLVKKTMMAAEKYKVKTILLAGGVAANERLREKMKETVENINIDSGSLPIKSGSAGMTLSVPPLSLCTDNAVSMASAGFFNYSPTPLDEIVVDPGLEVE